MAEKNLIVDGLEINYSGLFDLQGLLKTIDDMTASRGYRKAEKRRAEEVTETGKEFSIELRPSKVKQAEVALSMKIRISVKNLQTVDVTIDNLPAKLDTGDVNVIIDGWEVTDWESRWEQTAWYMFFRNLYDRFIKKFVGKYEGEVIDDTHFVYNNIKAHLELHKYKVKS